MNPRLIAALGEIGIAVGLKYVEASMSAPKLQKAPSPSTSPATCTSCSIFTSVAMAHTYIRDLKPKLNPDGSVPLGLGGTIVRAQGNLRQALLETDLVKGFNPKIDDAAIKLQAILPDLIARMNSIQGEDQWNRLIHDLNEAEQIAYLIPENVYRRDLEPETKIEVQEIAILSEEEQDLIRQFREAMGKS